MKLNPSISAIVWSLVSLYTVTAHAEVPTLFISEYLEGASNNKALELYNNTDSNLILDNYRIEIYFNGNTSAGATIKLSGTLAAGKTYVIAHSSASFADTADKTSGSLSFNGNDAVVLKNGDSILDSIGQIGSSDYWSNGSGTVSTQNMDLRRSATVTDIDPTDVFDPGAQWTDYSLDDFSDLGIYGADDGSNGDDGGDNPPITELSCDDATLAIGSVQGNGLATPLAGQQVEIGGVVTAVFPGLSGFYVQDAGDADDTTSDGIFIYAGAKTLDNVTVGDTYVVSGIAAEYYDNTQLTNPDWKQCGVGSLPAAVNVTLPVSDLSTLEALEGMLVHFDNLTINDVDDLANYGEMTLSNGRRMTPTQVAESGEAAAAIYDENRRNAIVLDEGVSGKINGTTPPYPYPGFSANNSLRVGDTVSNITGPLYYSFNQYHVSPITPVTFDSSVNPRSDYPELLNEGNIRVASFNVLNFFNGDGAGAGFPTSRGASTYEDFLKQKAKIVAALSNMQADVIGLLEIENDGYGAQSAIAELTEALSEASGQHWAYINPGVDQLGTDVITSAFIYRPDVVTPIGAAKYLDKTNSIVDENGVPLFNSDKMRPTLGQTFKLNNEKAILTTVINHLRSKGGSCGAGDDDNSLGGSGACNGTRNRAATAIAQWVSDNYADQPVLLMGDFNAYAKEDPILTLGNAGFERVNDIVGNSDSYSYVYDGLSGQLDHALANDELACAVVAVTEWHINADETSSLEYDNSYADDSLFRSSDHDPVVLELALHKLHGVGHYLRGNHHGHGYGYGHLKGKGKGHQQRGHRF
ncbi:ExeM/NucH family extracellular endonuclease [Shewanella dokdonensis]|uniref:ExeM/NucH family extracellular endonuclease n=1 Tax=Shewanella dokdonensis TaxID=712036 RepID=UPI00200C155F|nr:ExeM/NucH family extracellular endonuclease [Shewanella dokdonensis]MCL1074472.1 ExeM/NucH family extracellular endonuclease [Shewanella dokdonensis]